MVLLFAFMSTVLEDCPPYEQVGTHGMVVDEDGTRFQKRNMIHLKKLQKE